LHILQHGRIKCRGSGALRRLNKHRWKQNVHTVHKTVGLNFKHLY